MHNEVVLISWLLRIILQWIWNWRYLWKNFISFILDIYPEVDSCIIWWFYFKFLKNPYTIFIGAVPVYTILAIVHRVSFSLHPGQYLLSLFFFIKVILADMRWFFIMVWFDFSYMWCGTFFLYLMAIRMCSLKKCLFSSSAHCLIRFLLVCFAIELSESLMYFGYWHYMTLFGIIFSHSIWYLFILLTLFYSVGSFYFGAVHLFIFIFVSCAFGIIPPKTVAKTNVKEFSPYVYL